LTWALALITTGVWAARENRRWVVNLVAVFGSIHFYTQYFERLGASPESIVVAGLAAIGIALALVRYNRSEPSGPPAPLLSN
jgi:iron complex transport system permease protein